MLPPENAKLSAVVQSSTLQFTVRDSSNRPAPSVRLDFTAPLAGASCLRSAAFAITGEDGVGTVTCTPNCVAGSYEVTARPVIGPAKATIAMTNAPGPCRRRAVQH